MPAYLEPVVLGVSAASKLFVMEGQFPFQMMSLTVA